jgi:hypothetical protein
MVLGMIHGLVFIPVLLSIVPLQFFKIPKHRQMVSQTSQGNVS